MSNKIKEKIGKWIPYHEADFGWDEYGYECSECGYRIEDDKSGHVLSNYCPRCGSKMFK